MVTDLFLFLQWTNNGHKWFEKQQKFVAKFLTLIFHNWQIFWIFFGILFFLRSSLTLVEPSFNCMMGGGQPSELSGGGGRQATLWSPLHMSGCVYV